MSSQLCELFRSALAVVSRKLAIRLEFASTPALVEQKDFDMSSSLSHDPITNSRPVRKGHRARAKSILLVEPLANARGALQELLEIEGYQVDTAADQVGAIESVAARTYDLAVTEIVFAGGKLAADYIARLHQTQPAMPILVVSGLVGCETFAPFGFVDPFPAVRRSGADLCLSKPIQLDALLLAMEALCRGRIERFLT